MCISVACLHVCMHKGLVSVWGCKCDICRSMSALPAFKYLTLLYISVMLGKRNYRQEKNQWEGT